MKKFNNITKLNQMIHGGDYNPDQWLDYPEVLSEDVRLMKLAHINSASMCIFGWAAIEPEEGVYTFEWLDERINTLYENGIYTVLATPSGARPAWLDEKYPEVMRTNTNRVKNLHGIRHNHCYTSPIYRQKVTQINRLLADRYKNHEGVIMWHISNEFGGECHCELCCEAFRAWLRVQYDNDIKKLNQSWWTSFWSHTFNSFDQITSPAPHGENQIHGMNLDWRRFVTYQTNEFIKAEVAPLRELTPNIPITTNFMGTYDGLDCWKLKDTLDVISWDSYPRWHNDKEILWETASDVGFLHDINRSLKGGQPFMLMESTPTQVNWQSVNKLKENGMHLLSSLQAVAHGSDTVQYFQFRKSRGASEKFHGAVVDHVGNENTRAFREITAVGSALKKLDRVCGTSIESQVAIIYDWNNRWAIDDFKGARTKKGYEETCELHYRAFWKRGISTDIIDEDQDFSSYKLIVAPMLYLLKDGVADRLKQFVANGGTLVTTYLTGYVNKNDLCFLKGLPGDGLGEVIGIWAEELDALFDNDRNSIVFEKNQCGLNGSYEVSELCELIHAKTAEVLAVYGDNFYKGMPALTKNQYEKGTAYHIAARTGFDMLDVFYGMLSHDLNLSRALPNLPEGVTAQVRENEKERFVFVSNFTKESKTVNLDKDYENILTGEKHSGSVLIEKYGVVVLK